MRCRKGFTLVELAIVLVIIGLLTGGILVGQALIENTRKFQYIKELQAIKFGYDTFVQTFREKPGDFSRRVSILGGSDNGNGNGVIAWLPNESGQFWVDICKSNPSLIPPDYSKDFYCGAYYLMRASGGFGSIFEMYYGLTGVLYFNDSGVGQEDSVILAKYFGGSAGGASLKGGRLAAIDFKMDDGNPWTGKIRGHNGSDVVTSAVTNCSADNGGTRAYILDSQDNNCLMIYLIERY